MSLGSRLLVLVLIAALPVLAVQVVDQLNEREVHRAEVASDALRTADLVSEQLSQIVEAARGIAITTAHLPEVQARDAQGCSARVRQLIQRFPQFVGIGVVGPDGRSFCRTTDGPVIDISDRPYFHEALRDKTFTASGYIIGRNIQRPSMVFAAPALDQAGEVLAVVVVAYDLQNLSSLLARARVPTGASISVVDLSGVVVARFPAAANFVGYVRNAAVMDRVRDQRRGTVAADGPDGIDRVYGFARLGEPAQFYAMVGMPLAPAMARIDNQMWRQLALLAAIFSLAAIAALVGGEFSIRRPLIKLQDLARRLAAGELSARADLDRAAIGEVGALATSLDNMARAVQDRDSALRSSEEFNRRILESSRDCIKVLDLEGRLRSINACGLDYLEIASSDEVIGAHYLEFWNGEARAAAEAALAEARAGRPGRFTAAYRTPSGRETWWDEIVTPICNAQGQPERLLVTSRDISDIKQAAEHREALLAELDHRVKNSLAAIKSVARQTLRPRDDVTSFIGRLEAMGKAHSLLSNSRWKGAELSRMVRAMLDAYGLRITIDGPPVLLGPKMTQTLGMAVHELATNAAKYGALSVPSGTVSLTWSIYGEDERRLVLEWRESGGPAPVEPAEAGFGINFIRRSLAHEFGGTAEVDFRPEGLYCRVDLQLGRSAAAGLPPGEPSTTRPPMLRDSAKLVGKRVLLVEDEMLVAMELEAALTAAGCEVVGPAASLERAMALSEMHPIDAAVLDVNLAGTMVFPLAVRLEAAGVPFVFVTGYNSRAVFPPEFQAVARVGKPIQENALVAALSEAMPAAKGSKPTPSIDLLKISLEPGRAASGRQSAGDG